MNIFVLSLDPRKAARSQCDKHVNKMLLESVQMLCNPVNQELRERASSLRNGQGVYKSAHVNHPCSKWTRETAGNWVWLLNHAWALFEEYKFRYQKQEHGCEEMLRWLDNNAERVYNTLDNSELTLTSFALAMPEEYKTSDPVEAYINFYKGAKTFAKWEKGRPAPTWWNHTSTSTSSPVIEIT